MPQSFEVMMGWNHIRQWVMLGVFAVFSWSCSVPTDVVDPDVVSGEALTILEQRYTQLAQGEQTALTLSEAMATAIVYNYEHRSAMMRKALAVDKARLSNYDFLPNITADAGYRWRTPALQTLVRSGITNTDPDGTFTGDTTPPTYLQTSSSNAFHTRVGLSYSVLDFVMAYVRKGELANRALIAAESQRRVVQNIIQQVRSAYWRAVAAERMLANMSPVMIQLNDALRQSELAEVQRLVPPLEALEYQRSLYALLQRIDAVRRELMSAKVDLAVLMNARPDAQFHVYVPHDVDVEGLAVQMPELSKLEIDALRRRPELRQAAYQQRVSLSEGQRALAGLLPGVNLFAGFNFSTNGYLRDNVWFDIAPSASVNLLNVFKYFSQRSANRSRQEFAREKAVALSAAIIAQVNLANIDFRQSIREYNNAEKIYQVNRRILRQIMSEGTVNLTAPIDRIQAEADNLLSQLLLDVALAYVQDSYGRLLVAIGDDPLPVTVLDTLDVSRLTPLLETYNQSFGVRYDVPVNLLFYNL